MSGDIESAVALLPAAVETAAEIVLPTEVPAAVTPAPAVDALLAEWVGAYIHNSPISQSTPTYNHFMSIALPALRLALTQKG
jgi:hypothetical protein